MNKKGEFQIWMIGPILFLIGGCVFGWIVGDMISLATAIEESCEKIGMEYHKGDEFKYCIEPNGQAHYVTIDCEDSGFWKYDCVPKIINIGDVRVINQ